MDVRDLTLVIVTIISILHLALTLRLVNKVRAGRAVQEQFQAALAAEVAIGERAPSFRALTLAGQWISQDILLGRDTILVFVSPACDHCRDVLGDLEAETQVVLVADSGPDRTAAWLRTIREEDDLELRQPVLAAPTSRTSMIADFNPQGLFPWFCHLDVEWRMRARGAVGGTAWQSLISERVST